MTQRVWNFSAGPGVLPLPVLEEAQRDLLCLPGVGASVLEISHRSKHFDAIIQEAEANLRQLLSIPDHYHVLFLQGGASLQFAMVAMNLLGDGSADYILTGSWGEKAVKEAQLVGNARIVWNGKPENFVRTPHPDEYTIDPNARYVHFTSNETIQGVAFATEPSVGDVPLVCDMSSDFLSRPVDIRPLRAHLRRRAEERGTRRRDDCDYPRRHGAACARFAACNAELPCASREQVAV
jgi:phosphoserine aminotransferase